MTESTSDERTHDDELRDRREREVAQLVEHVRSLGFGVMMERYVDENAIAALLDVKQRTVRSWRKDGTGPPYYNLARVLYRLDEFLDWMESRRRSA